MKNKKGPSRSILIAVLILAILMIGGITWYSVDRLRVPDHEAAIERKRLSPSPVPPAQEAKKPVSDSALVTRTDSVQSTIGVITDSSTRGTVKVHHPKKKTITAQPVVADDAEKKVTTTPSQEAGSRWKIVVKKDMIYVYPGNKWQNLVVVYPDSGSGKESKHILKPDFPGIVYLDAVAGNLDLNNKTTKVLIEKYTASEAVNKMPFLISLRLNPSFIIFGDCSDNQNQYIFQDNKVSGYEAHPASEQLFSLNSK